MTNQPLPIAYAFTNSGVFDSNDGVHFVTGVSGNSVSTLFANQLGMAVIVGSNSIVIGNTSWLWTITPPSPVQIAAGYFLSANGAWVAGGGGGGGTPGGSNNTIQFSNGGVFAGDPLFTYGLGTVTIGNSTVNATVNSTVFTGLSLTSNSASFIGVLPAANVVSNAQLQANLANYPNTTQLAANLANYTNTAGIPAIVGTNTSNNTAFVGSVSAPNVVSNAQLQANLANYTNTAGLSIYLQNTYGGVLSGNVQFSGANVTFGNSTVFSTINSTAFSGTANNATNLGGVAAASYVQNTDSRTLSGNLNFTGSNVFFTTGYFVGSNVVVNTSVFFAGNSTVNSVANSTVDTYSNSTVTVSYGLAGISIGANLVINTTVFWSGNSTVNSVANSTVDTYANSTVTTSYGLGGANVGSNVVANTTGFFVGNSTVNASMNSSSLALNGVGIASAWVVQSANYNANNGDKILADTSGGAFTVTLPASPSNGAFITFADAANTWSGNNLTINPNGANVAGASANLTCDVSAYFGLLYDKTGWQVAVTSPPASSPSGAVAYNVSQNLNTTQTAQARSNIGLTGVVGRVHMATGVSVTAGAVTKIAFDTVDFDPTSCWDSTNKWFKPKQSGTYLVTASVTTTGTGTAGSSYTQIFISKNGNVGTAANSQGENYAFWSSASGLMIAITCLVQMNGSTDTIEADLVVNAATSPAIQSSSAPNFRTFMHISRVGD